MLTAVDFRQIWGDTPVADAVGDFIASEWRGVRMYIPKGEMKVRFGGSGGGNERFVRELREVVERAGGGDREMQLFFNRWGNQHLFL